MKIYNYEINIHYLYVIFLLIYKLCKIIFLFQLL